VRTTNKITNLAIAVLITGFLAGNAYGETSAKEFFKTYDAEVKNNFKRIEQGYQKALLQGMSIGIGWANTIIENETGKKLWCQPAKLAVSLDQDISMLRLALKEDPTLEKVPLGMALIYAYKYTFPCHKQ
jgi:hypothetical protein